MKHFLLCTVGFLSCVLHNYWNENYLVAPTEHVVASTKSLVRNQAIVSSAGTALMAPVTVSGRVFNDVNANTIINTGETSISAGGSLYVHAVNSSGVVVSSVAVASGGTYSLTVENNQTYTLELSTVQYSNGTNVATNPINNNPPLGWITVGENGNNNTGSGDGTPDGVLTVAIGAGAVINQNFALASECNPLAPGNTDTDGDGISDACDSDDDNDGIPDSVENECLNAVIAGYPTTTPTITPSDFGIAYTGTPQLGLNLTKDISDKFGYAANAGAVIVTIKNANVHPTANAFYVRGDLPRTEWQVTGSVSSMVGLEQGLEYYANQRREINVTSHQALVLGQSPTQAGVWQSGVTANTYFLTNVSSQRRLDGMLHVALLDYKAKKFDLYTNDTGLAHWSTYFIRVHPECDYDKDGIPNRLDLDSDNDGCPDALEGTGPHTRANLNPNGSLSGSVSSSGIPTQAGSGQNAGTSYNENSVSPECQVAISGTVYLDTDGDAAINGTPTNGEGLSVNVIQNGIVVYVATVGTDCNGNASAGAFCVPKGAVQPGTYTLQLTKTPGVVGSAAPATSLNDEWVYVGESLSATGNDGVANGLIDVTATTADVTGIRLGINDISVLPVRLVSFNAKKETNLVSLQWTTASELNNLGFQIERSPNALQWESIGFVKSLAANGQSTQRLAYTFNDSQPLNGANYYRLKQTDQDGKTEYSNIRVVVFKETQTLKVYPNPTSRYMTVDGLQGGESISIYNSVGQLVQKVTAEDKTQTISLSEFTPAIYQVIVTDVLGTPLHTFKVVKTR